MSSLKFNSGKHCIQLITIIGAGLAALLLFFNQPIPASFVAIIFGTLILGMIISRDAAQHARPIIIAHLSENHREIVLENTGTLSAEKIQITAAGIEEPWNIQKLEPDVISRVTLPAMVSMLTVEVTYQVADGSRKSKVFILGSPETEQDPFKPMFPLFDYKEKK